MSTPSRTSQRHQRRSRFRAARGQTLVLFVLTTLLLALMVLVTLQVGVRVKEKHELQVLADAAAYSNAVATARTMNEIAVLNRAQVAFYVSMAADQGLISWSSFQRAQLYGFQRALTQIQTGTGTTNPPGCSVGLAGTAAQMVNLDAMGTAAAYAALDAAAGTEVRNIQLTINTLRDTTEAQLTRLLGHNGLGARNPLTEAILEKAKVGSPFPQELEQHHTGSHVINGRELSPARGAAAPLSRGSGMVQSFEAMANLRQATLGSRGEPWTVGHEGIMSPLLLAEVTRINTALNNPGITVASDARGGHVFGGTREDDPADGLPFAASFAHDHGNLTVTFGNCTRVIAMDSDLTSTDLKDTPRGPVPGQDSHVVTFDGQPMPGEEVTEGTVEQEHHTLVDCIICPAAWFPPIGLNPGVGDATADANANPKLYSVLHRDLSARGNGDPWNLVFTFDALPGQGGQGSFDNRSVTVRVPGGAATDISRQTALSTGMAYYHRKGHWQEFPNLLNPYWRATLVSADVDAQGKLEIDGNDDVPRALDGPQTQWQAEAFRALKGAGFQGLH